jgi:beta-N-acetylhexosaminidase
VSAAALTGLLRGELGFTGVIVSDALEMRATRDLFGIPGAGVLAVAAGTDLLCLGREGSEDDYLAVRDALVAAVRDGTLDGERLEEAADRVARLRGGLARARSAAPAAGASSDRAGPVGAGPVGAGPAGAGPLASGHGRTGPAVGLVAARRAVLVSGPRRTLSHPVIIEVEPRENIAAGRFGWGLGPWAPAGSVHRVSASGRLLNGTGSGPAGAADSGRVDAAGSGRVDAAGSGRVDAAAILAAAAGRSLVAVVRDAHRDEQTRSLVSALLAARPDLVLVEMGLPLWHPPEGTSYLATYGASRASAHAAAEVLGLA